MKIIKEFTAVLFVFVLLCGLFAITAYAKDLEPCRLCGGKGDYHCVSCGNTGTVTCGGCNGTGVWHCPGEEGKGKCNNGYYTCKSCNGDTYARSGDGQIPPDAKPGSCSTCGGKGKIECWTCHGNPTQACDKCGGTGKEECPVGTCKVSRQYNWKCPDCKGTGYILVGNPMPPKESNDGVRNVPKKGDYIVTNDKTWAGYNYGGESKSDASSKTTVSKETQSKKDTNSTPIEETQETADFTMPEDRNTVYEIPVISPTDRAKATVETGKMSDKEQLHYAELSEEKLGEILSAVRTIVSTAKPGEKDKQTEEIIEAVAEKNGIDAKENGQFFPILFDGHQDIGFPVKVSVTLESGELAGGSDIFVYHITEGGEIEKLGKADIITYPDGSIEELSFYTTGFSSFFTARQELNIEIETTGIEETGTPIVLICVITVCLAIIIAVAVFLIMRKKRR